MAKFLRISGGVQRSFEESSSLPAIYDDQILIVESGASGDNQLNGPISAGTSITLPSGATYHSTELEIVLNKYTLEDTTDYNYVGGTPPRTQIQFTFDLAVDDVISFRKTRNF